MLLLSHLRGLCCLHGFRSPPSLIINIAHRTYAARSIRPLSLSLARLSCCCRFLFGQTTKGYMPTIAMHFYF
jgi:hypothetical protein